ncbi:MAG: EamA family transporter RarD [Psychromonas sp.]|nr:EamA family transporter RarD [Psychromonas sp.]
MKNFSETHLGVIYALAAYLIWGFVPLYFKYLGFIPVYEMLAHRVIWSVVFIALILTVQSGWPRVLKLMQEPKRLAFLAVSTLLISTNWLVFIWAINNEHMLDASLGYFINPLVNVVLGVVFLKESLSRIKWVAIVLAFIGVAIQVVELGSLPWISLVLPMSFAFYGLVRKKIKVQALTGLFIETLLVFPFALFYLNFMANSDTANLLNNSYSLNAWLMFAGVVTALPLIFFAQAALRLQLSTLGFFQYLAPSLLFIFAVLIYNEPLSIVKMLTFMFIWSGVLLFAFENKITARLK